ncbi:MAG: hypothetical protein ACKOTF_11285, partial [Opitutaceae bacterium]
MSLAARLLVLAFAPALVAAAADAPSRSAPTRPGAVNAAPNSTPPPPAASSDSTLPGRRFGRIEYVSLAAAAPRLGARRTWVEAGRRLELMVHAAHERLTAVRDHRIAEENPQSVHRDFPALDLDLGASPGALELEP